MGVRAGRRAGSTLRLALALLLGPVLAGHTKPVNGKGAVTFSKVAATNRNAVYSFWCLAEPENMRCDMYCLRATLLDRLRRGGGLLPKQKEAIHQQIRMLMNSEKNRVRYIEDMAKAHVVRDPDATT